MILFLGFDFGDVFHHIFEQIGGACGVAIEATIIAVRIGMFIGRQQFPLHRLLHIFHQIASSFGLLQLGQSLSADAKKQAPCLVCLRLVLNSLQDVPDLFLELLATGRIH